MKSSKNKLIIIGGSIIAILIAIIFILYILSLNKTSYYSYEEFERKLINASETYYKNNPQLLPVTDGEHELSYTALVSAGLIKPLNEMIRNSDKCSVYVNVVKNGESINYIPHLTCPDYITKEFHKVILEHNPIIESGNGLYLENGEYIFKGENLNNYIMLGASEENSIWRIVKINADNTIKIVQNEISYKEKFPWDDRYNEDEHKYSGYNNFEISRIKDTLINLSLSEEILTNEYKNKVVATNWCVGKRSEQETDKTTTVECKTISNDKIIFGLLTASEILNASTDKNCNSSLDKSCTNYNYLLKHDSSIWTITAESATSYKAYSFDTSGLNTSNSNIRKKLLLATNISNQAFYKSGTGTIDDPYILR